MPLYRHSPAPQFSFSAAIFIAALRPAIFCFFAAIFIAAIQLPVAAPICAAAPEG